MRTFWLMSVSRLYVSRSCLGARLTGLLGRGRARLSPARRIAADLYGLAISRRAEDRRALPGGCLALCLTVLVFNVFSAHAAASYKVMVFSATAGFRHDSITNGIAAIQALGSTNGFAVDAT